MLHPLQGAWIEILTASPSSGAETLHPLQGAWIEICSFMIPVGDERQLHPLQGTWIEIGKQLQDRKKPTSCILYRVHGLKFILYNSDFADKPVASFIGCMD